MTQVVRGELRLSPHALLGLFKQLHRLLQRSHWPDHLHPFAFQHMFDVGRDEKLVFDHQDSLHLRRRPRAKVGARSRRARFQRISV